MRNREVFPSSEQALINIRTHINTYKYIHTYTHPSSLTRAVPSTWPFCFAISSSRRSGPACLRVPSSGFVMVRVSGCMYVYLCASCLLFYFRKKHHLTLVHAHTHTHIQSTRNKKGNPLASAHTFNPRSGTARGPVVPTHMTSWWLRGVCVCV
jgi:hypothetical protein